MQVQLHAFSIQAWVNESYQDQKIKLLKQRHKFQTSFIMLGKSEQKNEVSFKTKPAHKHQLRIYETLMTHAIQFITKQKIKLESSFASNLKRRLTSIVRHGSNYARVHPHGLQLRSNNTAKTTDSSASCNKEGLIEVLNPIRPGSEQINEQNFHTLNPFLSNIPF